MKICAFLIGPLSTRHKLFMEGLGITDNDLFFLPSFLHFRQNKRLIPYLSKFLYSLTILRLVFSKIKSYDSVLIWHKIFLIKWLVFLASTLSGKRVILDVYVSEFDVRVNDRHSLRNGSLGSIILKSKERLMLMVSSHSFFLSSTDMHHILNLLELSKTKVNAYILPLCVELKGLNKSKRIFVQDKLNFVWWGSFNKIHGLDLIIRSLWLLHTKYGINFHLDVFGVNQTKGKPFMNLVLELDLIDKVSFHFEKSFADGSLTSILCSNNYDMSFGLFGDLLKARNVVSNKLVESLALGLPHLQVKSFAFDDFEGLKSYIHTCEANPESIAETLFAFKQTGFTTNIDEGYLLHKKYFSKEVFLKNLNFFNENIIYNNR